VIAHFIGIGLNESGTMRVAFLDAEERSWWVDCPINPSPLQLAGLFQTMELMARDPHTAVELGILEQQTLDKAIEARNEMRLKRSLGDDQKVQ